MGNYITVQVTKVPGAMKTITLETENKTVADALAAAEITAGAGYEIRVDDDIATEDTVLSNGAVVVVTKMIKGN